jgi:hypothetical protein
MKTKDISNLIYNPIWIGILLNYFLSGSALNNEKGIKFELIYFVLPMLFDENIKKKLTACNKSSTYASLFNTSNLKNRLIGFDKKILAYKDITNKALITIGSTVNISSDGYAQSLNNVNYSTSKEVFKDYLKAAYNLGNILSKDDYREIFMKLGVNL